MSDARSISMTRILANFAEQQDCIFTINGYEEAATLVFSPEVFLSIVATHAELNFRSIFGFSLGTDFQINEDALFGVVVRVPDLEQNNFSALRAAFFVDAMQTIFGLTEKSQIIECGPVFELYQHGLLDYEGEISWPVATTSPR